MPLEAFAFDGEGADVVHDLAAEVVLAILGDADLLLDGAHQPLVGLVVLAGVAVLDLLLEGEGLDVVDVVGGELGDGFLVGGDGALDLVLDDVLVLDLDEADALGVALALLFAADEGVVAEALLELVHNHERVDGAFTGLVDQGVGDLVLHVAGADALHAFALGLLAQLLDVVLGVTGEDLAIVELELLDEGEIVLLGVFEAREDSPHGGDFEGVGSDVLALDLLAREVLLVDADLLRELRDVGDVDLDSAVAQRLHELVVQELLVLRLVGVTDDHLVDVRLRELLRLDLVLLGGAEQVVQERDVELEHLDELHDAPVGDVELAVEVEGAGIGVGAVLGDLSVVDVAGELGGVLVLLVLGLEGADADTVLLGEHQPADAGVLHDLGPVAVVLLHETAVDEAACGIEVTVDTHVELLVAEAELADRASAPVLRDEAQGLLVHRTQHGVLLRGDADLPKVDPRERVQRAVGRAAVVLEPLLQQPRDGGLGGADRTVQQDHPLLRSVALGRGLEHVHQTHQRDVEAEDGVCPLPDLVAEEVVANELLLAVDVLLGPEAHDHVVDPLERVARHLGPLTDDLEVVVEGAFPGQIAVQVVVLHGRDPFDHVVLACLGHRYPRVLVARELHVKSMGAAPAGDHPGPAAQRGMVVRASPRTRQYATVARLRASRNGWSAARRAVAGTEPESEPPPVIRRLEQDSDVDGLELALLEDAVDSAQDAGLLRSSERTAVDSGIQRTLGDGASAARLGARLAFLLRGHAVFGPAELALGQTEGPVFGAQAFDLLGGDEKAAGVDLLGGQELAELAGHGGTL